MKNVVSHINIVTVAIVIFLLVGCTETTVDSDVNRTKNEPVLPFIGNMDFDYDAEGNITDVYSTDHRVYLDKQVDPVYSGGFGADIRYKGFTLSGLFSFQADAWRSNGSLAIIEDAGLSGFANMSTSMLDAWTTPGQTTAIPALSNGGLRAVDGDRYIEDASFLRLRNVTFAYNFSSDVLAKTKVFTAARIFLQGTNLVTWTKWRGFDPENNGNGGFFDYPVPKNVSIGFDLTF